MAVVVLTRALGSVIMESDEGKRRVIRVVSGLSVARVWRVVPVFSWRDDEGLEGAGGTHFVKKSLGWRRLIYLSLGLCEV